MSPALTASGPALLVCLMLVLLYHGIAVKLVTDWYELPDFSHGFLVPFFAAFLLWDKRRQLQSTAIEPSWAGVWLVALGLFVLLLGIFGADLFLQRTSFVLLAAGLVWTLLGREMLGRVKFVLFVLLLAIPLPTILFNQITFPLQILASQVACAALDLLGIPVLREGNVLHLAETSLSVVEACSGIRSLLSLTFLSLVYGYFFETKIWLRVVLFLATVPIAIVANASRVTLTGVLSTFRPELAEGFFHTASGLVIFMIAGAVLIAFHQAVNLGYKVVHIRGGR